MVVMKQMFSTVGHQPKEVGEPLRLQEARRDYKNRKCRRDHTTRKPPKRWYCGGDLIEISDDELEKALQLDDDVPRGSREWRPNLT